MLEEFKLMNGELVYLNVQCVSSIKGRDKVSDVTMSSGQEFVVAEPADDLVKRIRSLSTAKRN